MYEYRGLYQQNLEELAGLASSFSCSFAPEGFATPSTGVRDAFADHFGLDVQHVALAMLSVIRPGGFIPLHRDNPAVENGLEGELLERFHLVIATNERCWNYHEGYMQQLHPGRCYAMDPSQPHASVNYGDSDRIHLVFDVRKENPPHE